MYVYCQGVMVYRRKGICIPESPFTIFPTHFCRSVSVHARWTQPSSDMKHNPMLKRLPEMSFYSRL